MTPAEVYAVMRETDLLARLGLFAKLHRSADGQDSESAALFDDALAALRAAQQELREWRTWGVIEIAVRNPNVSSYVDHWEGRTLKAESELTALRTRLAEIEQEMRDTQKYLFSEAAVVTYKNTELLPSYVQWIDVEPFIDQLASLRQAAEKGATT